METLLTKRRLGIVGGMGAPAGAWLFNRVITLSGAARDQDYPEILLHSNAGVPDRTRAILGQGPSALPQLVRSVQLFNDYGVDVAAMACMTAYHYYAELAPVFHGLLVNPLDLVCRGLAAAPVPVRKVGLMGSTGLLRSGLYQRQLEIQGVGVLLLNDRQQEKYFMEPLYGRNGIKAGATSQGLKDLFWEQAAILLDQGADALVGACSEVPLVVDRTFDVPFYNVFELLARELADLSCGRRAVPAWKALA
jgi:aspartate racemase